MSRGEQKNSKCSSGSCSALLRLVVVLCYGNRALYARNQGGDKKLKLPGIFKGIYYFVVPVYQYAELCQRGAGIAGKKTEQPLPRRTHGHTHEPIHPPTHPPCATSVLLVRCTAVKHSTQQKNPSRNNPRTHHVCTTIKYIQHQYRSTAEKKAKKQRQRDLNSHSAERKKKSKNAETGVFELKLCLFRIERFTAETK